MSTPMDPTGAQPPVPGPPAGWYPDPANPAATRWWDGTAWTDRIQPPPYPYAYGQPQTPGYAPAPGYPQAPGYGQPAGYPPGAYPPAPGYAPYPGAPAYTGPGAGPIGPDGRPLASFWRRLGGYLIDGLIVAVPISFFAIPLLIGPLSDTIQNAIDNPGLFDPASPQYDPQALQNLFTTGDFGARLAVVGLLALVVQGIYWIVGIGHFGRTVGGLAVGIRAIDVTGAVPGYRRATIRFAVPAGANALGLIPYLNIPASALQLLIYLWMLWDPQRQGLMDKAAGTYVIRDR